jgi:hypothetical protein
MHSVQPFNLIGKIFGTLKIIKRGVGTKRSSRVYWVVKCLDCGIEKEVQAHSLLTKGQITCGNIQSCQSAYNVRYSKGIKNKPAICALL